MTKKPTPLLDALLDRVAKKCAAERGRKSELARILGVAPQFIYKWVVLREYEPGGEVTLQMAEWVKPSQSQKPKYRGGATNTTTAKTRSTPQANEKDKRVRKNQ